MISSRHTIFSFLMAMFCISRVCGQTWNLVYPNNLEEMGDLVIGLVPPNGNNAYLIGNDILSFDNDGNLLSYIEAELPFQENSLRKNFDVQFISETEARMIFRNKFFSTSDTGQTWIETLSIQPVNVSIETSSYFNALNFPNQNTGYAVGSFEKLFKTEDGGFNWQELSSNSSTAPYIWYTDVYFLNELNGYVSGFEVSNIIQNFGLQAFVLQTNDGGLTWQRNDIEMLHCRKSVIDFKNNNTGFIFFTETQLSEKIFVTNDGAQTWTDITPEDVNAIYSVKWMDTAIGLIYVEVNGALALLKTIDQGHTWYNVPLPVSNNISKNTINDIVFLNDSTVYTIGIGGGVFFSQDTGETWIVLNESNVQISEITFTSESTAYASTGTELYKSIDAGQTWSILEAPGLALSNFVLRLDFRTPLEGLILGFGNQYARTIDGFNTFNISGLPETFFFSNKFISSFGNNYYVAGTASGTFLNVLLVSGDGGVTWQTRDIGLTGEFVNNLQVLNDGTLVVLTDFNIISSADEGITWNTFYNSNDFIMNSFFLNTLDGFAYSSSDLVSGQVRKIINDGSLNTEIISIISSSNLESEFLTGFLPLDGSTLLAYGFKRVDFEQFAIIWKSVDGGLSWTDETLPFQIPGYIEKMTFTENSILAFASQGQILRTSIDVLTLAEELSYQRDLVVYPNPTNDFLKVHHSFDNEIEANIFSLQGQLINATLLSGKESFLDISHLKSGVYILKIIINERSISKKIIKL